MNSDVDTVVKELNEVKVVIAELRTQVGYLADNVKTLTQKLDQAPNARDVVALETRLAKVEANLNKAAWAIIGAWVSGLGVLITFLLRGH
jgi:uncharacterized coiled-coil protein SlyX